MSKPLVDSSANRVDRPRLCLTLRSRRFLPHASPQTRAYRRRQQTPERCRRPIARPHLRIPPTAAVQIPIALWSSADCIGDRRGFLLWGLSNACPSTSAAHPRPPLEGRHRTTLTSGGPFCSRLPLTLRHVVRSARILAHGGSAILKAGAEIALAHTTKSSTAVVSSRSHGRPHSPVCANRRRRERIQRANC